jgi:hypothetical protein
MRYHRHTALLTTAAAAALLATGCTGGVIDGSKGFGNQDGGVDPISDPYIMDGGSAKKDGIQPNWDAFFAKDPPPQYCGPDGGAGSKPPPTPGGTPDCPSDKNREGCPCTKKGQTAACWPGMRVNRNRGICKDGVTTCQMEGELKLRWGTCTGYVLPKTGETKGPGACTCFSKGIWAIKNLSPCFVTYSGGTYVVSTYVDSSGQAKCPTIPATPPPKPQAGTNWSENMLTVDCAGQMKLCFTIKAGDANKPAASDCVIAQSCTSAWYAKKNTTQTLPPLPGWFSTDTACAKTFDTVGGYGEMSVIGKSAECQLIDDKGSALVFHRITYCPLKCSKSPNLPECKSCGNGGSGSF